MPLDSGLDSLERNGRRDERSYKWCKMAGTFGRIVGSNRIGRLNAFIDFHKTVPESSPSYPLQSCMKQRRHWDFTFSNPFKQCLYISYTQWDCDSEFSESPIVFPNKVTIEKVSIDFLQSFVKSLDCWFIVLLLNKQCCCLAREARGEGQYMLGL